MKDHSSSTSSTGLLSSGTSSVQTRVSFRSSPTTFFEPADDGGGRDAEGSPESAQARALLVSTQDLLLALLGVAVGGRIFAALTPAGATEVLLLAVIGGEAVFDEIVASAVSAVDDFGNHTLILARHSHHSSLVHYPLWLWWLPLQKGKQSRSMSSAIAGAAPTAIIIVRRTTIA